MVDDRESPQSESLHRTGPPQIVLDNPVATNLVPCPDCGHLVSKRAAACPRCGAPILEPNRPDDDDGELAPEEIAWREQQAIASPTADMIFVNPANGYRKEVTVPWLWTLLFGFLYFAAHGVWTHAIIGLVLACVTFGVSWLLYPFFASSIIRQHYLGRGWKQLK